MKPLLHTETVIALERVPLAIRTALELAAASTSGIFTTEQFMIELLKGDSMLAETLRALGVTEATFRAEMERQRRDRNVATPAPWTVE